MHRYGRQASPTKCVSTDITDCLLTKRFKNLEAVTYCKSLFQCPRYYKDTDLSLILNTIIIYLQGKDENE